MSGRTIAQSAREAYWRLSGLIRSGSATSYPPDFSAHEIQAIEAVAGKTMTTVDRLIALIRAVEYLERHTVEGDFVECGVWKGGSMMAAALTLMRLGNRERTLHLYDTYDGMPPPTVIDRDYLGNSAAEQLKSQAKDAEVWARAQLDEVEANMRSTGYPLDRVCFIKGRVEETIPGHVPERIALLRLDTDWYESTRHEMLHLFPRLVPGGVLILDDYGHWEGARRAVDEYIAEHDVRILLCRIDATGRIALKQE
jgi:O-methyltransferase